MLDKLTEGLDELSPNAVDVTEETFVIIGRLLFGTFLVELGVEVTICDLSTEEIKPIEDAKPPSVISAL